MSLDKPFTIEKPWGFFRQFTHNEETTVKILSVKAGEELSLQTHKERKEFWYVASGDPTLTIGDKIVNANPGDEFTLEKGMEHRITTTNNDVVILEISYGNFDEEDIVRIEDRYNRI